MIGIINYKAGNAPSVQNALLNLDIPSYWVSTSKDIKKSKGLILPGVGSAKATMDSLKEMNCLSVIKEKVFREQVPFLGICIGLQVLFDYSEEDDTDCLGWIPGIVKKFPDKQVRIPQMGWNKVQFIKKHPVLSGLTDSEYFYFVNSYYALPESDHYTIGSASYGVEFCAMIAHKNIIASQFHVEKSGIVGLKILKNFALMVKGGDGC